MGSGGPPAHGGARAPPRLGYDAEASFSRAFKRIIGTPPSHFRKNGGEGGAIRDFG
jgi:AraC-like DNA-binding protein